jgi:hypothetical protein
MGLVNPQFPDMGATLFTDGPNGWQSAHAIPCSTGDASTGGWSFCGHNATQADNIFHLVETHGKTESGLPKGGLLAHGNMGNTSWFAKRDPQSTRPVKAQPVSPFRHSEQDVELRLHFGIIDMGN